MEIYCKGEIFSSIVNDGIREFYTFLGEDPTCTKSTKSTNSTKTQKAQKATFFILDAFMHI